MGKPGLQQAKPASSVYHDDPTRDDAASTSSAMLLRDTVPIDASELDEADLPPYTETSTSLTGLPFSAPTLTSAILPPPDLDPCIEARTDYDAKGSTYTRLSPTLSVDPVALRAYIEYQATQAPRAYARLYGEHVETRGSGSDKKKNRVVDFDVLVDLSETVSRRFVGPGCEMPVGDVEWGELRVVDNARKVYRGSMMKRVDERFRADIEFTRETQSLEEWCHLFCASGSVLKSFTLTHRITNRNDALLHAHLVAAIRRTNYRGRITVTFQLHPRTLTILAPNLLNRLRTNIYVRWFFYLTFLWILSWPVLFLATRRWAVVEVCWPFKRTFGEPRQVVEGGERRLRQDFEHVRVSEGEWARKWGPSVERAVLSRVRKGEVVGFIGGVEEVDRRAVDSAEEQRMEREREPTGGFVGGALAILRGMGNMAKQHDDHRGWGYDT